MKKYELITVHVRLYKDGRIFVVPKEGSVDNCVDIVHTAFLLSPFQVCDSKIVTKRGKAGVIAKFSLPDGNWTEADLETPIAQIDRYKSRAWVRIKNSNWESVRDSVTLAQLAAGQWANVLPDCIDGSDGYHVRW